MISSFANSDLAHLYLLPNTTMHTHESELKIEFRGSAFLMFKDKYTKALLNTLIGETKNSTWELFPLSIRRLTEIRLLELGVIGLTICDSENQPHFCFTSTGYGCRLNLAPTPDIISLHPYAYIRSVESSFILRNPLNNFQISFSSLNILDFLSSPPNTNSNQDLDHLVKQLVWAAGFAISSTECGEAPYWQFEDVLFHTYSRGRSDYRPRGATYPYKERYPEPKPREPHPERSPHEYSTDPRLEDVTFSSILEGRRSIRGERPTANVTQLLNTLAITTRNISNEQTRTIPYPTKAYPAAGGIHELSYFILANKVNGLSRGLYAYHQKTGTLSAIDTSSELVNDALKEASESWGTKHGLPKAVIYVSANLPLMMWKYESVAYRMALLDAGVAIQTICQVACALQLATCPLGTGNSELFSKMINASEWAETSIAEIAIAGRL